MSSLRTGLFSLLCLGLGGCSSIIVEKSAESGRTELFDSKPVAVEHGIASWYKDKRTASGERFDVTAMTAAHKKLPFGTKVRVIDLKTHNSIIVRINDRGPYKRGRVIDLTIGAARKLGMYDRGLAKVRLEVLKEIPIIKKPNLHLDTSHDSFALKDSSISSRPHSQKVASNGKPRRNPAAQDL